MEEGQALKDALYCCVCFERYTTTGARRPLALLCGHVLCCLCQQQLKQDVCVVCRKKTKEAFAPHYGMIQLLKHIEQLTVKEAPREWLQALKAVHDEERSSLVREHNETVHTLKKQLLFKERRYNELQTELEELEEYCKTLQQEYCRNMGIDSPKTLERAHHLYECFVDFIEDRYKDYVISMDAWRNIRWIGSGFTTGFSIPSNADIIDVYELAHDLKEVFPEVTCSVMSNRGETPQVYYKVAFPL